MSEPSGKTSNWYVNPRPLLAIAWLVFVHAFVRLPLLIAGMESEAESGVFMRPACWLCGHDWADEDKFGVQHVCLTCGKR